MFDRFDQLLFNQNVKKDFDQLDGSQIKIVLKALKRIEDSNGEIGDDLGRRKDINLLGYKKLKLKKHGIRIIFKKTENKIIVAEFISIGKREDLEVYREALKRSYHKKK